MRTQFCEALVLQAQNKDMVFLTGDLGFMALEPLRAALGDRFVNAGVAEQNMISVAAGLAKQGMDAWAYSIAPFCYARGFEQIRNDVAFHGLAVKIVGNGGGYGYGVMGPTHHAIEDYGVMLTLPKMKVFVPIFDQDMEQVIPAVVAHDGPSYLRLGRGEPPKDYAVPAYKPWRQLTEGGGPVVVSVGPLAGTFIAACNDVDPQTRPILWAVAELPLALNPMPDTLRQQIALAGGVVVAEEHVRQGSFAADLALHLMQDGAAPVRLTHLHATAHHFSRYGSQGYMRRESGLDPASLLASLSL